MAPTLPSNKPLRHQRGVALLTALVVLAIAVVLASAMLWQTHLSQRRSANILFSGQGWQYLRGAEDWATHILRQDAEQNDFDHLNEAWTTPLTGLAIEGGQLSGQITDLQGHFNLNNLRFDSVTSEQKLYRQQLRRLLTLLEITAPIEDAIADWVDTDNRQSGLNGAEDGYYLRQLPAYRSANAPFESISELRQVKGVTPEIYAALAPHVTALPASQSATPINVNTATAPVLASLFANADSASMQAILESRANQPYETEQEFKETTNGGNIQIPIGVQSNFFLLHTQVSIGSLRISMYSLLQRGEAGNTQAIKRALGTL